MCYLIITRHPTLLPIQDLSITCTKPIHLFLNNSPTMLKRTLCATMVFRFIGMEESIDSFPITITRLVDSYDWIDPELSIIFKDETFYQESTNGSEVALLLDSPGTLPSSTVSDCQTSSRRRYAIPTASNTLSSFPKGHRSKSRAPESMAQTNQPRTVRNATK